MRQVLNIHSAIYNQFHGSSACSVHGPQGDEFAAYYTSMYLIQDTGEAVMQHMVNSFSDNTMRAYLEFWGVMQAINIQQDAIFELYRAVAGGAPTISPGSFWRKLRDARTLCAGHPAHRAHGRLAPQRTFISRSFGNYGRIKYELWDAGTMKTTHPVFNLRQMIDGYDKEASQILCAALASMKSKWP